jgi:uncharacterized membrane protein
MNDFLTEQEEAMLVEAIREQERRTSAEIRICVSYRYIWRPERFAWRNFEAVGMQNTEERNGVLIVMLPRVKTFVMIGDEGLNALVPPGYWKESVKAMVREMHETDAVSALCVGLKQLGDTLAVHWPRQGDDVNELPDKIIHG